LLAHGRWFSPGTPASYTTKTGCHDITEILLNNTKNQIKSKSNLDVRWIFFFRKQTLLPADILRVEILTNQQSDRRFQFLSNLIDDLNYIFQKLKNILSSEVKITRKHSFSNTIVIYE
jgi:hypothetical protein